MRYSSLDPQSKYKVLTTVFKDIDFFNNNNNNNNNNVREINMTIQFPHEISARMQTIYEGFPKVVRVGIEFGGRDLKWTWEAEILMGIVLFDIKFGIKAKCTVEIKMNF